MRLIFSRSRLHGPTWERHRAGPARRETASARGSAAGSDRATAGWHSTQSAKGRRRRHTAIVNSTTIWPEWKAAKPGQRVRMNRTGWSGTVVNVNRFGVRVRWDQSGYEGVVVAPAFDLTPI